MATGEVAIRKEVSSWPSIQLASGSAMRGRERGGTLLNDLNIPPVTPKHEQGEGLYS